MTALNRVQLIGALGAEPKICISKSNSEFASVSLATNERYRQHDEWKTLTEWHNLVFFGNFVGLAKKLKKGDQLFVEGKIRTNKWADNEGVTRTTINIVVSNIQIINRASSTQKQNDKEKPEELAELHLEQMRSFVDDSESVIPF